MSFNQENVIDVTKIKEGIYQTDEINLDEFHHLNKEGKPVSVFDYEIAEDILDRLSIIMMEGKIYIYENGVYIHDEKGAKVKEQIKMRMYPKFIKSNVINRIYNLIIDDASIQRDHETCLNNYPKSWINFRNGFFDLAIGKIIPHDPKYISLNQIPIYMDGKLDGAEIKKSISYQFIESFIPDENDRRMFLEFVAYSMTNDTSAQKFLILSGVPGIGKSVLLKMVEWVIGTKNISNVTLQNLNKRFYPTELFGKIANICADLPSTAMEQVDEIKKIIGEDTIMGEYKGGNVFSFKPYTKLIFSANDLPITVGEYSEAYARRLLVLPINKRARHFDNLEERLMMDRFNFAKLLLIVGMKMYHEQNGSTVIFESNHSKMLVNKNRCDSDSVFWFIEECCDRDNKAIIQRNKLHEEYIRFCDENNVTPLSDKGFYKNLRAKGYYESAKRNFHGLSFKESDFRKTTENPFDE